MFVLQQGVAFRGFSRIWTNESQCQYLLILWMGWQCLGAYPLGNAWGLSLGQCLGPIPWALPGAYPLGNARGLSPGRCLEPISWTMLGAYPLDNACGLSPRQCLGPMCQYFQSFWKKCIGLSTVTNIFAWEPEIASSDFSKIWTNENQCQYFSIL